MSTLQENLIDLFELDKMEPAKAAEMVERLAKLIFQGVLTQTLPLLEESDLDEYEKIVDGGQSGPVIFNFLKTKIPDFDKIVEEEAKALHKEMAESLNSL